MPGHVRACSGMPGHVQFQTFRVFLKKKLAKNLAIIFAKMLDFGLVDANLRGFEAPFFKIFSSRRAPLAGGDGRLSRPKFSAAPPRDLGGVRGDEIFQKQQSRSDFYSFFERFRCFQVFFV